MHFVLAGCPDKRQHTTPAAQDSKHDVRRLGDS
jgi:hypothetical protein